jgi:hypothetical protein
MWWNRIKSFFSLDFQKRTLLLKSFWVVGIVRICLSLVGTKKTREFTSKFSINTGNSTPSELAWSVRIASKVVYNATCLTQAISLQAMLSRSDLGSVLRIGTRLSNDRTVEAHAWVLIGDDVLIGDFNHDISSFTVLLDLETD